MTSVDDQISLVTAPSIPTGHSQSQSQSQSPTQFDADLLEIPQSSHKLFNDNSILTEDLLPHVIQVRDRAFRSHPSQALGHFEFLTPSIARSPAYDEILLRLKKGGTNFIDIGCGLGQDLRQLAADGAPAQNLYGVDSAGDLIEYGTELFGDSLNAMFVTADIFGDAEELEQISGHMDIVWCGRILDTLTWEKQVGAIRRMLQLLRKGPNAVVVGRVVGRTQAGNSETEDQKVWHDVKSFKKLFHEACDGQAWETEVVSSPFKQSVQLRGAGRTEDLTEINFVGRRLERVDLGTSHKFVF